MTDSGTDEAPHAWLTRYLPRGFLKPEEKYGVSIAALAEEARSWGPYSGDPGDHLKRIKSAIRRTSGWAIFDSVSRQLFRHLGTAVTVGPAILGVVIVARGNGGAFLSTLTTIVTGVVMVLMVVFVWRASWPWLTGAVIAAGILGAAALVRVPQATTGNYFSAVDVRSGIVDSLFLLLIVDGLLFGYLAVLGGILPLVRLFGVEAELLRRALAVFDALRSVERTGMSVKMKRHLMGSLKDVADTLASRPFLNALRTGDLAADQVIYARIFECVRKLREMQVWVALPRLDTLSKVRTEMVTILTALSLGAYHQLPMSKGEVPVPSVTRRIGFALSRVAVAVLPIGVLITFTLLGLRLPHGLDAATYMLTIMWLVYWIAQAMKLDVFGFVEWFRGMTSTTKSAAELGGKEKSGSDDRSAKD